MPGDKQKSLQSKQPGIEYASEGNGWPEPLTDPSNPVKYSYVNGKSGTTKSKSITNLSSADVKDAGGTWHE